MVVYVIIVLENFRKGVISLRKRTLALLALLALLCIGAAELTASYFYAPQLFDRVTAPVIRAAQTCADFVGDTYRDTKDAVSAAAAKTKEAVQTLSARLRTPQKTPSQLAEGSLYDADAPIADPSVTELQWNGGREYLTGGIMELVYYCQTSPVWADLPYGTDDIGRYGCGPTAMAMVVSSMTDRIIEPPEMASWAAQTNHWAKQSGSYLSIVNDAAQAHGLTAYSIADHTPDALVSALLDGDLIVALMGPGHFTRSGHFIVIHGVTLTGNLLVADPNSMERSLMEWEPQLILDELSKSRHNGAPLWGISAAQSN